MAPAPSSGEVTNEDKWSTLAKKTYYFLKQQLFGATSRLLESKYGPIFEFHAGLPEDDAGTKTIGGKVKLADTRVFSAADPVSGQICAVAAVVHMRKFANPEEDAELRTALTASLQQLLD